jgi:hypothetical protein
MGGFPMLNTCTIFFDLYQAYCGTPPKLSDHYLKSSGKTHQSVDNRRQLLASQGYGGV